MLKPPSELDSKILNNPTKRANLLVKFIILLIRIYQLSFSSYFPACCRYEPSCSNYTIICFQKHSFFKACKLSLKRILSCRPYGGHGYDPVPENNNLQKLKE